ncbi:MAG: tetratricopeptide repeat protein [Verrucomicrobiota bacterium]
MKYILLILCFVIFAYPTLAAPSKTKDPSPAPEIEAYNSGTELLKQLQFAAAEKQLRQALKSNEKFPESHNNLAYALRKQGPKHFEKALRHYNRAIELDQNLAEAYMYRGVLYVQMGQLDKAQADLDTLKRQSPRLAKELDYVIQNQAEKTPEKFFGVAAVIKE